MKALTELRNLLLRPLTQRPGEETGVHETARGIPVPLRGDAACHACDICQEACPTGAIRIEKRESAADLHFDYGACLQCGLCASVCPPQLLVDSGLVGVFALTRDELRVRYRAGVPEPAETPAAPADPSFRRLARRGFNYREIAAGGNGTVECELNASFNATFDSESHGIRCVASPKHADALVVSGPVSPGMSGPLRTAWDCLPAPRALIACGTEATSGGLFARGEWPAEPDLWIAGDPPRPDTVLAAFRLLLGRSRYSFRAALQARLRHLRERGNAREESR